MRDTLSKRLPVLELPLRFDRFPWLDLDELATFRQSPCEAHILQGIANARVCGLRVDDFDKSHYTVYSNTYEEQYPEEEQEDIFFDALEYSEANEDIVSDLELYFTISTNCRRLMRTRWMVRVLS